MPKFSIVTVTRTWASLDLEPWKFDPQEAPRTEAFSCLDPKTVRPAGTVCLLSRTGKTPEDWAQLDNARFRGNRNGARVTPRDETRRESWGRLGNAGGGQRPRSLLWVTSSCTYCERSIAHIKDSAKEGAKLVGTSLLEVIKLLASELCVAAESMARKGCRCSKTFRSGAP